LAGDDPAGMLTHPGFGGGVAFGVEAPGRRPQVFQDVHDVDHDRDGEVAGAGLGADPVDLVTVAVHQGDPGPFLVGVAAGGLVEPGTDHLGGVLGDADGQPFAVCGRRGQGFAAWLVVGGPSGASGPGL
jgi:hypothetical protein